jgi:hypothetical protein
MIKRGMDAGYCLTRRLRTVMREFSLTSPAYNLKRVINIPGYQKLMECLAGQVLHRPWITGAHASFGNNPGPQRLAGQSFDTVCPGGGKSGRTLLFVPNPRPIPVAARLSAQTRLPHGNTDAITLHNAVKQRYRERSAPTPFLWGNGSFAARFHLNIPLTAIIERVVLMIDRIVVITGPY